MGSIMKAWEEHIVTKKDFNSLRKIIIASRKTIMALRKTTVASRQILKTAKVKLDLFQSKFKRMFPE